MEERENNKNQKYLRSSKKRADRRSEGNIYDKIMRENLQEIFMPLIAEELKVKILEVQPLPDKQPTTVIRETDSFLLLKTDSKIIPKLILHLEFESKDDPDMIYRMSEHHGIELRKYRLPIRHIVIYLGKTHPKMRTSLRNNEVFKEFTLVNAQRFSPESWLSYEEPEKVIMAILGDYEETQAELILYAILARLRSICESTTDLKKFIQQLIILSRMRNLEQLTIKISEEMPIHIDIEKDYLYNRGLQKGAELLAEVQAKLEAKLKEERQKLAKVKAEAKARIEAEAKARIEAEAKARIEAEAKAKAEAETNAKVKAEKQATISRMLEANISKEMIANFLGMSVEEVEISIKAIEQSNKLE